VNGGTQETVAMQVGGWKTRSVFIRYAIVSPKDIEAAMENLQNNSGELMAGLEINRNSMGMQGVKLAK
jgi:hypothetical protein